jgi:Secretion system C-terminal sorting domain
MSLFSRVGKIHHLNKKEKQMRRLPCSIALMTAAVLAMTTGLFAQTDTLRIYPSVTPGVVNTVINGDTLAGGLRAHPNRVYVLSHGAVYQETEPFAINGNVTIVGNDTTAGLRPPVLAPAILTDNSSIDHYFDLNGKGGAVTLKNIYITAFRADQNALGWSDGIRVNADSVDLTMDGVVWDGFSHTVIQVNGQWNKELVQNCTFRNDMHSSSYFGGGAMLSGGNVDMDSVIWVNNTFFCTNSYDWSIRGFAPAAVFSHNTLVYGTVNPFLMRQGQIMNLDNNLFYAMHSYGGIPEQVIQSWFLNYPDTASTSIMRLRAMDTTSAWTDLWAAHITGPEVFIGTGGTGNAQVTSSMVDPAHRHVTTRNNDNFWPAALWNFIKAYNDTVKVADSVDIPIVGNANGGKQVMVRKLYYPTWWSDYSKYAIAQIDSEGGVADTMGTMNADPGFTSDVTNQMDSLNAYVRKIADNTLDRAWYYYPPTGTLAGKLYPPAWPLPENLAYSNTTLQSAGTDGFAVGDLNWFPTQKAAWLAAGGLATGVQKVPNKVPANFALSNNYPNPFNPSTDIKVSLKQSGLISLTVYNVLGQVVQVVDQGYKQAGEYIYNVNMDRFASGVYFYTLRQGTNSITKKMLLLK